MNTNLKPGSKPAVDKWLKSCPEPEHEEERIQELDEYEILDTLPEPQFDAITELASNICNTEIALVSLIDTNRQWFKSKVGLDVNETSRDISFCQYAIMENVLLEINDTWESELLRNNPLVTGDPKIRFYAGAPLKTKKEFDSACCTGSCTAGTSATGKERTGVESTKVQVCFACISSIQDAPDRNTYQRRTSETFL